MKTIPDQKNTDLIQPTLTPFTLFSLIGAMGTGLLTFLLGITLCTEGIQKFNHPGSNFNLAPLISDLIGYGLAITLLLGFCALCTWPQSNNKRGHFKNGSRND